MRAKLIRLDSLVSNGIAIKEFDPEDLPIWEIPILWKFPDLAQKRQWPLYYTVRRAFMLPNGYRLTLFTCKSDTNENSTGEVRLYTIDKMGKRGLKPFDNVETALGSIGITT